MSRDSFQLSIAFILIVFLPLFLIGGTRTQKAPSVAKEQSVRTLGSELALDAVGKRPAQDILSVSASPWVITRPDAPKFFEGMGARSLTLDAAGYPHIAYGGDLLYYAWYNGTTWFYETADRKAGVGTYTSLDLDTDGEPHISYYDSDGALKYAHRDTTGWHTEKVEIGHPRGTYTSLALDTAGRPHISCYGNGLLRYARFDGSVWISEAVDVNVGGSTALALDSADRPHISYHGAYPDQELKYTWYDGTTWQIETVDIGGNIIGEHTSLALDATDRPHISYYYETWPDHAVKYAHYDGTGWQIETVDSGWAPGYYTSLALDTSSRPHISYYDWVGDNLKYAFFDGADWISATVDSMGNVGLYTSLALDADDRPHISYLYNDSPHAILKYAVHDGTAWQIEAVDNAEHVGSYSSLALDNSGLPNIVYCRVDVYIDSYMCDDLKYAYHDGTAWQVETVDSQGYTGRYASLALGPTGQPHISYCSDPSPSGGCAELRYAYYGDTGWNIQTVDSGQSVGYYASIGLDTTGHPHIAYFGHDPEAGLKHAYYDGDSWQIEIVDSPSALRISLALDSADRAHVVYDVWGKTSADLRYAHFDGTCWLTETIETTPFLIAALSLALNPQGQPAIAYWHSDKLIFSYNHGDGWQMQTVDDSHGFVGQASLAFDIAGRPHIAYHYWDGDGSSVRYAYSDGSVWMTETVDLGRPCWHGSCPPGGKYTSLALDTAGRPHISYHDEPNGDLKYAYLCSELNNIQVQGPLSLIRDQEAMYRASALPFTASVPITFTWNNDSVGPTATYSWPTTGTYTLTITGTNACGQGWGNLAVQVLAEWPYSFYLPLVMRADQ